MVDRMVRLAWIKDDDQLTDHDSFEPNQINSQLRTNLIFIRLEKKKKFRFGNQMSDLNNPLKH